jgi:hypothetical protein
MAAVQSGADLTAILGSALAADDYFAVWDTSAADWRRITKAELVAGLNATVLSVISGTSHTVADADAGKILVFTSASAIALTVPAGISAGFQCGIVQRGAGQITVGTSGGATVTSYGSLVKTAGQGATASLTLVAADDFVLGGTLGA